MLLKQVIILFFILNFTTSVWALDDTNKKTKPYMSNRYGWNLYDLTKDASVILIGRVERIRSFKRGSKFRFFKVTIEDVFKGTVSNSVIYLVEPPYSRSLRPPALFYNAKYLLFLSPSNNKIAIQDLGKNKIKGPNQIFSTENFWKGAVSLDSKYVEMSNRAINNKYKLDSTKEMPKVIQLVCEYMKASDIKKKQMADQLRQKGGIYKQFIEDDLKEKASSKLKK